MLRINAPDFKTAWKLDTISLVLFEEERRIPWTAWVGNMATKHPAFRALSYDEKERLGRDISKFVQGAVESLKKVEYLKQLYDQPIVKQLMRHIPEFKIRQTRVDAWKALENMPSPDFSPTSMLSKSIINKLKKSADETVSAGDLAEDIVTHQDSIEDIINRYSDDLVAEEEEISDEEGF